MRIAYKWVRAAAGPSEAEQDAALLAAGFTDLSPERRDVYRDGPQKRKQRPGDDQLPGLTDAIRAVHPGDVLCIAFPHCFGHTEAEAMRRLADLIKNGGSLYVASLDATISTVPEMEPVLRFLAARAAPMNKARTEAARKIINKQQRAALLRKVREVKPLWADPDKTVTEIMAETGHSRSTLYRWQREGLLPKVRGQS